MADAVKTLKTSYKRVARRISQAVKDALIDDQAPAVKLKAGGELPHIAEIKAFSERYRMSSILPYESYDPDTQLFFNHDTVGFVIEGVPATGLDTESLTVLTSIFNARADAGTNIQVHLYADPNYELQLDAWKAKKRHCSDPARQQIFDLLSKNRVDYLKTGKWRQMFSDQPFLVRDFRLMLSYTMPVPEGVNPVDIDESKIDFLMRQRGEFIGQLQSAGIHSRPMRADALINIMSSLLNPSKDYQQPVYHEPQRPLAEQMCDEDTVTLFGSGVSSIVHKGESFSVLPFHVRQFPVQWSGANNGDLIGSFTNNIQRIPCPFLITLTVNVPDSLDSKGSATRKQMRATQMADSPIAKYVPQWKDRKSDWDFAQRQIDQGNKMLKAFYQIVLFTPAGMEQKAEQSLISTYASIGWNLSRSRYIPMHALLGALPMGLCQDSTNALIRFGHFSSRLSWTCANVAPWVAEWKGTVTPMMSFIGRRGQILGFSPFDNDKGNYNMSCTATSGAGKSFVTQEWVSSVLANGGKAFVIDAGHSYRNLCDLLGGTYIDFGEGSPNMNPFTKFFSKEVLNRINGNADMDIKEYIDDHMPMLQIIIAQMASPEAQLSAPQMTYLERGISTAIRQFGADTTITSVRDAILTFKDPETGRLSEDAKIVANGLYPYTRDGQFGRYFDGPNNIDLSNEFVVLELDALNAKGALQGVVLLILMMQINQVMYLSGDKRQKKLCIIDEAWRLMGSGRAGAFIEEGYRVARKHGGSFMTITQKISDYFQSDTARAAFANSDFELYLRQKPQALLEAEQKGYIDNSDGKVDVLKSLTTIQGKYAELAINGPDGLAVARFIVDPVTEKLYSTKAEEVDFLRGQQKEGLSLMDAVNLLLKNSSKR